MRRLVGRREVAAAADPVVDFRVVLLKLFVEPGQLRPHLQIAEFLRAEETARARALLAPAMR